MSRRPKPTAFGSDLSTAPIFAALGDGTRLQLIGKLVHGTSSSITDLAADSRLTRQAITKHLRVLEHAGLVVGQKTGRETRFSFAPDRLRQAKIYLERVSAQWDEALNRLKAFVESKP